MTSSPAMVGFLHPGAMGASISSIVSGRAAWVSEERSPATTQRAEEAGLLRLGSVVEMAERCNVIVSVCPPGSALEVAAEVADAGFEGVFADLNAVSPQTARTIAEHFSHFVDGGIIGPPVRSAGTTRLYLSGADASLVADLWRGSPLEVRVIDGSAGAASAVKACFATWTKASAAMLLAIRALARAEGVEEALAAEWATSMPDLADRAALSAAGTAPKAWRFVGEMNEQADAFEADDLPGGFSAAAAEIYRRMAVLKDIEGADLEDVLEALLDDRSPTD